VVTVTAERIGDTWMCQVQVERAGERSRHEVKVTPGDLERWGGGGQVEDLVRRSFEFLLEREPPGSILRRFDLAVIQRYFPEYDRAIRPLSDNRRELKGTIEHIHIAENAGGPPVALDSVEATAGVGLEGDRYARREGTWRDDRSSRDITLIEAEAIESLAREDGISLAPGESRRNITTRGIRLNDLVGKEFWIGGLLARGTKLCEPCEYLQRHTGKQILKPLTHRAGLRADLLSSGRISVGDKIEAKP